MKGNMDMKLRSSKLVRSLAGIALTAIAVTLLPMASGFWDTAILTSAVSPAPQTPENHPPSVQSVKGQTVPDVMIELSLTASDADGDPVVLRLCELPRLGTASIDGSTLQYTPASGKTGTDKFSYQATDTLGNQSEPAQIQIKITKNKAKLTYSDMGQSTSHYAALKLAEAGIMTGEQIGAAYFFHPNETVTRSEFIAMVSALGGLDVQQTAQTDFADDGGLSDWVKPYISAAAASGWVSGYPAASGACEIRGQNPITLAEASVLLRHLLGDGNAIETASLAADYAPAWAQSACAVLTAADILPSGTTASSSRAPITRETACELLYRTLEQL